jgi:hypothetical protein
MYFLSPRCRALFVVMVRVIMKCVVMVSVVALRLGVVIAHKYVQQNRMFKCDILSMLAKTFNNLRQ